MEEFEYQLAQEAEERSKSESTTENKQYVDDSGTVFVWDNAKKGYFPRIDDDFIARYQANYGYGDAGTASESQETEVSKLEHQQKEDATEKEDLANTSETSTSLNKTEPTKQATKRIQEPAAWFDVDDEHNTNVYVSNLPLDISEDDFINFMKKCGLIMKDERNQFKIKLYKNSDGTLKGDARCCYAKVESVQLALDILNDSEFNGSIVKVERAKFSLKGDFDPSKKPKRKKKDKEKMKKKLEKLLDWRPDKLPGERPKCEMTVIIKNMFDLKEFENEPKLILEYRNDLRDECEVKCGPVKKAEIFDRHPEGVALITFKEFEAADKCVSLMNGRWFAGRQLLANLWDGKTKYKIEETEEEAAKRIEQWNKFLEEDN